MLGRDTQKGTPFLCIKRRPLFIGKYALGPIRWVLPVVRVIAGIRGRAILLSQELRKHRSFLGPAPLSEGVTHPLFLILPPCGARPRARGAPARGRGPLRARDGFRGGGLALRVAGLRRLARPVPLCRRAVRLLSREYANERAPAYSTAGAHGSSARTRDPGLRRQWNQRVGGIVSVPGRSGR
jgi:hypothetical protein